MENERNETEKLAYNYGRFVGMRENASHGNGEHFKSLDTICGQYWRALIAAGAYADDENSQFKQEYREHYYAGMDTIPTYRWC